MASVMSADDWKLFLLCLVVTPLVLVAGPLVVPLVALALLVAYVFRGELDTGYESVTRSDPESESTG
jgi:hypothetical protein